MPYQWEICPKIWSKIEEACNKNYPFYIIFKPFSLNYLRSTKDLKTT